MKYQEVINFWFKDIEPSRWWVKDLAFDEEIKGRFLDFHKAAQHCELVNWRKTPHGRLAEIIILDQFSRNMFRDSSKAFAFDNLALALAQEAISIGADQYLKPEERSFLYMPFMHSESLLIHNTAITLYSANGIESNLDFEVKHKNIIERFGRYPHRNEILSRISTDEEIKFLTQPNSSF